MRRTNPLEDSGTVAPEKGFFDCQWQKLFFIEVTRRRPIRAACSSSLGIVVACMGRRGTFQLRMKLATIDHNGHINKTTAHIADCEA